ncbi:hypothetical protein BJX66DRAFT_292526 [Aspergillus keveii]|uniref:Uncharacterized protein n=1 Tax=Aspergillus keveii TaxID=714993 RepID=A0ABR4GL19_9EURO
MYSMRPFLMLRPRKLSLASLTMQLGHCGYTIWIPRLMDLGSSKLLQNPFVFSRLASPVLEDCCLGQLRSHIVRYYADRSSKGWMGG